MIAFNVQAKEVKTWAEGSCLKFSEDKFKIYFADVIEIN